MSAAGKRPSAVVSAVPGPNVRTMHDLPDIWRSRASDLERFAAPVAEAFREAADDLEEAFRATEESVTLQEAHAIGGYSIDHLQRLVASGQIANVGRKGKPRLRRADVPVKPGHRALRDEDDDGQLPASAVVASAIARSKT